MKMSNIDPQQKTRDLIADQYATGQKEKVIDNTVRMIQYLENKRLSWPSILVYLEQLGIRYEDSLEAKLRGAGL